MRSNLFNQALEQNVAQIEGNWLTTWHITHLPGHLASLAPAHFGISFYLNPFPILQQPPALPTTRPPPSTTYTISGPSALKCSPFLTAFLDNEEEGDMRNDLGPFVLIISIIHAEHRKPPEWRENSHRLPSCLLAFSCMSAQNFPHPCVWECGGVFLYKNTFKPF